jgi:hypothetical protein
LTDYDFRAQVALNDCDREPIHIPQAIQGHGLLLVLNPDALTLEQGAGAIEDLTGQTRWIGLPIAKAFLPMVAGVAITLEPADLTEMLPILMGMLGLAGYRTFEKTKGVAR